MNVPKCFKMGRARPAAKLKLMQDPTENMWMSRTIYGSTSYKRFYHLESRLSSFRGNDYYNVSVSVYHESMI